MAGKKGRSGRKPSLWYERADAVIDTVVQPKVEAYLRSHNPSDAKWLPYAELMFKLCQHRTAIEIEVEHRGTVALQDAAGAFQSRMDRVATRLGAAGMPEWPQH